MVERTLTRLGVPDLGVGIGLRVPHYAEIQKNNPAVDFFEIISENFMVPGGSPQFHLAHVLERYPVVQHGVSLGIGGPAELDWDYLKRLKQLIKHTNPPWLSDHFCWSGSNNAHLHDLLPLPYTTDALKRVAERAHVVQDYLELRFALENTSSYLSYRSSTLSEWEFISEIAERADIGILLDVNNVYVSAYNHEFDAHEFIAQVPHQRVVQIHLAGHTHCGNYIIDTHRGQVCREVWDLYKRTIALTGAVSTLIEWDDEIPPIAQVLAEAELARRVRDEALGLVPAAELPAVSATPYANVPGWKQGGPRELALEATSA